MSKKQLFAFAAMFLSASLAAQEPESDPLAGMSLEELMDLSVVTASNVSERLGDAPATVIVLSREDIRDRGYSDLSQMFDDLPGMQIVRPFGATYLKNYWRGYRNTIGDPYLLMVDGIVFNHLYFNTADVLVTFPMSNIERVEVVYGPASSIYGPNAFMGVVNIITTRGRDENGSYERGQFSAGSFDRRLADVSYFYQSDAFRMSVAGRIDNGDVDQSSGERYEYTKDRYYSDRRLWGGFLDNPELGGSFTSPHRNRGVDLRAWFGGIEAGVQYYVLDAGYGVEYAADRAQAKATWARPDFSAHVRGSRKLGEKLSSTTLVRYRTSKVTNDSFFVQSYASTDQTGRPQQQADFSYWQALNSSWSLFQDFDLAVTPRLSVAAGFKYEQKDLQKAYDIHYGPTLPASEIDASSYPYPQPPVKSVLRQNHITTDDQGVYVQGRFALSDHTRLNLGVRYDDNSAYGSATTLRAGVVENRGPWVFKALFGQAFQEPTPRLLYGGWTGSGSDPDLDPERSDTMELSASYNRRSFATLASLYWVRNEDTIVNTTSGAENISDREVIGLDYHAQLLLNIPRVGRTKLWGYYSHLFTAEEQGVPDELDRDEERIGDLANDQLRLGATAQLGRHLTTTLSGRYVSSRRTVVSNPVDVVPSYTTVDAFMRLNDLFVKGLGLSLRAANLFDEEYFHPGVREANAGVTPGFFDASGAWQGSGGFYNSLLPQPGRTVEFALHFDY